jgi:dTDP-4-amino-4,6-dideoxygalactose transaminase
MPVYKHRCYSKSVEKAREGAEAFYSGYLSLPLYPNLSADEQSYVIDALGQFCQKLGQPWEPVGPW